MSSYTKKIWALVYYAENFIQLIGGAFIPCLDVQGGPKKVSQYQIIQKLC